MNKYCTHEHKMKYFVFFFGILANNVTIYNVAANKLRSFTVRYFFLGCVPFRGRLKKCVK